MRQRSPLQDEIRNQGLTPRVKTLLKEKYAELERQGRTTNFDFRFIRSMVGYQVDASTRVVGYRKKLSVSQIEQIERILNQEIFKEEYPNGIEDAVKDLLSALNVK